MCGDSWHVAGHGLIMKIGDFGMSRQVTGSPCSPQGQGGLERTLTPGTMGTVAYSSPEVLQVDTPRAGTPPAELLKSDVYSFGVTLWEILQRKRPWEGLDILQVRPESPRGARRWSMGCARGQPLFCQKHLRARKALIM